MPRESVREYPILVEAQKIVYFSDIGEGPKNTTWGEEIFIKAREGSGGTTSIVKIPEICDNPKLMAVITLGAIKLADTAQNYGVLKPRYTVNIRASELTDPEVQNALVKAMTKRRDNTMLWWELVESDSLMSKRGLPEALKRLTDTLHCLFILDDVDYVRANGHIKSLVDNWFHRWIYAIKINTQEVGVGKAADLVQQIAPRGLVVLEGIETKEEESELEGTIREKVKDNDDLKKQKIGLSLLGQGYLWGRPRTVISGVMNVSKSNQIMEVVPDRIWTEEGNFDFGNYCVTHGPVPPQATYNPRLWELMTEMANYNARRGKISGA